MHSVDVTFVLGNRIAFAYTPSCPYPLIRGFWPVVAAGALHVFLCDPPCRGDSPFVGSALLRQSIHRKTKIPPFCNFFAIANSLLSLQSGNKPLCSRFRCIFGPQFVIGGSEQSLIAKKVTARANFLFLGPQGQLRGGAIVGIGPVRSYRASPLRRCGGG